MFLGTHTPRLDEKGRVILPAKFRDELQGGLVITRGEEGCLYVWPRDGFADFTQEFRQTAFGEPGRRAYARLLFSSASDEIPDKQGRITIPPPLREHAHLHRDCIVIGAMERVEIWDAQAWREFERGAGAEAVTATHP